MRRRDFLYGSAGLVMGAAPIAGLAETRPCPPATLGASGGTTAAGRCGAGDAEADWVARSTAPGVVWAHDFRNEIEVTSFDVRNPADSVSLSLLDGQGFSGGIMRQEVPGNRSRQVLTATRLTSSTARITVPEPRFDPIKLATPNMRPDQSDCIRFFGMPGSWAFLNDNNNGNNGVIERYPVVAINSATSVDIATTPWIGVSKYPAVDPPVTAYAGEAGAAAVSQRTKVMWGEWLRPFSALAGRGINDTVNDPGASLPDYPLRTWNPVWGSNPDQRHDRWYTDWFGHPNYVQQLDNWITYRRDPNIRQTGTYRGFDFWLQFRVRVSPERYQPWNAVPWNNHIKWLWIWTAYVLTPTHEIVINDMNTHRYSSFDETVGGLLAGYTGQNARGGFDKGSKEQPGGAYDTKCVTASEWYPSDPNTCFYMKPGEWHSILIHVIPGLHDNAAWGGPPTSAKTATGLQIWAASQSRIAGMAGSGRSPYLSIVNQVGASGYPFFYDNIDYENTLVGRAPPGWNGVSVTGYQNGIPMEYEYTRDVQQIIFKRGNAVVGQTVFDPEVDGIPCPKV